jgi:hypothetical protein
MCPLRVILIFLSATVFQDADEGSESPRAAVPLHSKVPNLPTCHL